MDTKNFCWIKSNEKQTLILNHLKEIEGNIDWHSCFQISTGLSDFHKINLTVMKVFCSKEKANVVQCRDYNFFQMKPLLTILSTSFSKL